MATVKWTGVNLVLQNMSEHERKVHFVIKQIALYFAPKLERYAKENATWKDRTGNARQSLHTQVHEIAGTIVRLYLSHGVDYGLYLELGFAGRYAIIWPTIEAHLEQIKTMLDRTFGR